MNFQRIAHNLPRRLVLAALAALAFAAPCVAAPVVFFGMDNSSLVPHPRTNADAARDLFVAAVGAASITTQDFETVPLGDFAPVTMGTLANGVGVTVINSATDYMRVATGTGLLNTYATSGSQYVEALSDDGSTYFTATFDQAVRAIGFYVTDASDWACCAGPIGELRVVLTSAAGTTELDLTPGFDPTELVDGNLAFFGVLDNANPFTSIAIRSDINIPDEDAIGFDDFMVGVLAIQAAPAPGTLALLLGMLPVLGFLRRRRG